MDVTGENLYKKERFDKMRAYKVFGKSDIIHRNRFTIYERENNKWVKNMD